MSHSRGKDSPEPPPGDAEAALVVPEPDLEPGARVGEFVVDGKLGEGGFGVVFKATHPLIGKQVAVKVLNRQYSSNPAMVSRFVAEARAVNQIRHRHIIDIFSFGQLADGRQYYVMELLDGQPLDRRLAERGRLPLDEALLVLRAVARALDAAHAQGIAHRDLKPENIFVSHDEDGTPFPKLLDFGIAKLTGDAQPARQHRTRTGAPMGTPQYMSPEQARGRDVDTRTDIYSFGIVAYQLVTGQLPFEGDDFMEIVFKQLSEQPTPPSQLRPELPAGVDRAIAWMMRKEAAKRPANLATAMRALEDAAAEAGVVLPAASRRTPGGGAGEGGEEPSREVPRITAVASASEAMAMASTVVDETPETWAAVAAAPAPAAAGAARAPSVTSARAPSGAIAPPPQRRRLVPAVVAGLALLAAAVTLVALVGRARRERPAPAPSPGAATVTLRIGGVPEGTEVFGPDGARLGSLPGALSVPRAERPLRLTLRARGFRTSTEEVTPTTDAAFAVTMEPIAAPAVAPAVPVAAPAAPSAPSTASAAAPAAAQRPRAVPATRHPGTPRRPKSPRDKNSLEEFE